MSTILVQPIPTFESGFPLTVDDLNNMFNYADEEVRQTRISLLGAGIFYGLDVTVDVTKDAKGVESTKLTISAGAGVTSQGYLFGIKEAISFPNYQFLLDKNGDKKYSSAYLLNTNTWIEGDVETLSKNSKIQPKLQAPQLFDFIEGVELVKSGGLCAPPR